MIWVLFHPITVWKFVMNDKQQKEEKLMSAAMDLVYLLTCAVQQNIPDAARVSQMNLNAVYRLAEYHFVVSAAAFALESAGVSHKGFEQDKKIAMRKLALLDIEREKILDQFESAKIRYLPLKGIVMQDFYPRWGMREMLDNDILCDASKMNEIRKIMESLGYRCVTFNEYHHDIYEKDSLIEFEIHRMLYFQEDFAQLHAYYADVFQKLEKDSKKNYSYRFTPDDFYIFMLSHEYKHYINGGTGLRSLTDTYVFLEKNRESLHWDYIEKELTKIGLSDFEKNNRELSVHLFSQETLSKEEEQQLMYYVRSGAIGLVEHAYLNHITEKMNRDDIAFSKRKYLFRRFFPIQDDIKQRYPFFDRHKWLMPALFVYRPVKAVVKRPKEIALELRILMSDKIKKS